MSTAASTGHAVTVLSVGDVMINRDHPESIFDLAKPVFAGSDVRFGNCESTYSESGSRNPITRGEVRADPRNVDALAYLGFDVMTFANNHHLDAGYQAFTRTLEVLHERGIATCGAGENLDAAREPAIVERGGSRIAFLGYSSILFPGYAATANAAGAAPLRVHTYYRQIEIEQPESLPSIETSFDLDDVQHLQEDIARARDRADVVVVAPHWGIHFTPVVIAEYERKLARIAIDAGADIILGCHQHILKGIEVYRGKAIFYGLGNFAMDVPMTEHQKNASLQEMQGRYPEHAVGYREDYPTYPFHPLARRSGIARFEVKGRKITRVGFLPCYINPSGQPEPLSPGHDRFEEVVGYVEEITAAAGLSTEFQRDGSELLVLSD
jgi:poly-gamma-glutamate capsule biosynthesis protein CapA/YwtB (metallophosphatase superfamily)